MPLDPRNPNTQQTRSQYSGYMTQSRPGSNVPKSQLNTPGNNYAARNLAYNPVQQPMIPPQSIQSIQNAFSPNYQPTQPNNIARLLGDDVIGAMAKGIIELAAQKMRNNRR